MRGRALAVSLVLLCASRLARATSRFELFPESIRAAEFEEDASTERLRLSAGVAALADVPETAPSDRSPAETVPAARLPYWERPDVSVDVEAFRPLPSGGIPPRPLFDKRTTLTSGGVLFFAGVYALSSPISYGFEDFHFHSEHWFGPNTYGGGADKASHFIVSASLARELALLYDGFGHTREQSIALGFGVSAFTGLMVELGDGLGPYGFSWEDLTMDVLGSATGLFLTAHGLNDVVGLRVGKVPTTVPASESSEYLGSSYSTEIYSADLKISGLARRLQFDPGPARFLLTSVTYSTKGYGYVPPIPDRQRLVGVELGLNMPEILAATGLPADTWWQKLIYKSLNFFRIPYTSFGWRYDLNHNQWHGPDTGDKYYRKG